MLVLSTGSGVHGFTLDPSVGETDIEHVVELKRLMAGSFGGRMVVTMSSAPKAAMLPPPVM